jgi:hypothetical protein
MAGRRNAGDEAWMRSQQPIMAVVAVHDLTTNVGMSKLTTCCYFSISPLIFSRVASLVYV